MSTEKAPSAQQKFENWSKNFCQMTIARLESLLANPDISQSQKQILLNLLKQQKDRS